MKAIHYQNYAKKIISRHLRNLVREKEGAIASQDIECLHRMRVASRRLRTSFQIFKGLFPEEKLTKWKKYIRKIARVSGKARDLDVLIEFLKEFRGGLKNPAHKTEIKQLLDFLRQRRQKLQGAVVGVLDEFEQKEIAGRIIKTMNALSPISKNGTPGTIYRVGRKNIVKKLNDLLSYKAYVYQPHNVDKLHRLRIAAKRLRYTLEAFALVYGKKTDKFLESVVKIQRLLGDLHNFDVWIESLPRFVSRERKSAELAAMINRVQNQCGNLRFRAYKKFVKFWKELRKEKFWDGLVRLTVLS